jgi:hypothetical protein
LKKIFFFILLFQSVILNAQSISGVMPRTWSLGFTIIPQLSWAGAGDNTIESGSVRGGFEYGLMADYNFTSNYAFGTGIYHKLIGATVNYLTDSVAFNSIKNGNNLIYFTQGTSVNYKLQYVEIPFSIKLKTNQVGYFTYFGQLGLAPSVNISAKANVIPGEAGASAITNANFIGDVRLFNLGILMSAGAIYQLSGNTSLMASLQFNNGEIDFTNDVSNSTNNARAVLRSLGLNIGIGF